jgi:polyisoprenoid-binding protein YceI
MTFVAGSLFAATYNLDLSHTGITFKVDHFVVSKVNGRFDKFEGALVYDDAKKTLEKVDVKIDLDSVSTNDPKRDNHLRSPDFFGVRNEKNELVAGKQFMTFTLKEVKKKGKKFDKVIGDLTLNGVTKPVTLAVDFKGLVKDPWGYERLIFTASTKIPRKDFGITWNKPMDPSKGSEALNKGKELVVGEIVDVIIESEAIKAEDTKAENTKTENTKK